MVQDRLATLGKDGLLGTRLVVAQIDMGLVLQFFDVLGEGIGAVMAGPSAQFMILIGEGRLDNEIIQPGQFIHLLPKMVIRGGITTKGKYAIITFNTIPNASNNMIYFNHFKAPVIAHKLSINFIVEVTDVANNGTRFQGFQHS